MALDSRRTHAPDLTFRSLDGNFNRSIRVVGVPTPPALAHRMDSLAEHEPHETPYGSLRPAAKAAAKQGIPRRNHWQRRPREYWVGMDYPEYHDSDHCRGCSPAAQVLLVRSDSVNRDYLGVDLPHVQLSS